MLKLLNNVIGTIVTLLLSVFIVIRVEAWATGMKPSLGGELLYYAITMSAVWGGLMLFGLSLAKLLPERPASAETVDVDTAIADETVEPGLDLRVDPESADHSNSSFELIVSESDPMTQLRLLNEELRLTDDPQQESAILAQMSALTSEYAEVFELSDRDEQVI